MPAESRRPVASGASRAARAVAGAALAGVAALHLLLLGQRLADATIAEPAVASRWLLSGLVVAAALALHRRHAIARGRAGLVLAAAVLLLHVGALDAPRAPALAALLVALPAGLAAGCAAWTASRRARWRAPARRRPRPIDDYAPAARALAASALLLVPRPPPLGLAGR